MFKIWQWNLRQIGRQIWVPVGAFGALGLLTAVAAALSAPYLEGRMPVSVGAEAVSTILEIMAASMLTVTTFSLSIMLAAFASAAQGATPRAITLLRDDGVTQGVLATFVGAFVFSLTGIIGLQSGFYGSEGRVILFCVTLLVVTAVILQLLRWIGHLADYGRLGDTLGRVERATRNALRTRLANPYLGGIRQTPAIGEAAMRGAALTSVRTGYVQVIDMEALNRIAEKRDIRFSLTVIPGSFAIEGRPLLHVVPPGALDPDDIAALRAAVAIAPDRTFDQDPRFGLLTLSEIAQRALSPAVNDPGTAIDVLGRQMRLLAEWRDDDGEPPRYPAVYVPGLSVKDMMNDAFAGIARDGAGTVEVQLRLHKMLAALAESDPDLFGAQALRQSRRALALSAEALPLDEDQRALATQAERVRAHATASQSSAVDSPDPGV